MATSRRWSAALCLLATGLLVAGVHHAQAGSGDIQLDNDASTGELTQGRIRGKIYVDRPRTQREIDRMNEQLQRANRLLCDSTSGLFRIEQMTYVNHPAEKRNADIIWLDRADRAYAEQPGAFGTSPLPNAGRARGFVHIYGDEKGETIAHELAHLIFGVGDQYAGQTGRDPTYPFFAGAGISGFPHVGETSSGRQFFRSLTTSPPLPFKDLIVPGAVPLRPSGMPLYENGAAGETWYLVNNTLMQQSSGQYCRTSGGMSAEQANPPLWPGQLCLSDADDNADGISDDCGPRCGGVPTGDPCARTPSV